MPNEQKVIRKLRAILSADVKGYSLLMADDEIHTIQTLKAYRSLMSDLIQQHSGRVVDNPGDNLLADFSSAVDAAECAVQIQNRLKKENAKFVEDKRLQFRIGVNIGDVVQDGECIYGDGVNITARIEGLAEAGGICVSRSAYDQVKGKLELGFDYIGEHDAKNITEPIRVYKVLLDEAYAGELITQKYKSSKLKWFFVSFAAFCVIGVGILGGLYWRYLYLPTPTNIDPENKMTFDLPQGPSIAVLPFVNMSGDPKQEFFCDGITENIISALSQAPKLFVISRNSTFAYKGRSIKIQEIGHELGVKYVIEGSVQKSIDDIRVTVQLVETIKGNHIWSNIYDRKLEDIFEIQDEITFEILKTMQIVLTDGEKIRHRFENIKDLKSWLKLTKAINLYYLANPTSNNLAQNEVADYLKTDPNNSYAYALLGMTYVLDLWYGSCESPLLCLGKAIEAVRKALQLDANSSDAHSASAMIFFMRKDHERAIAESKIGISLNPNNADAYQVLGVILNYAGRPKEGIEFIRKAIRLNPIPNANYLNSLGFSYLISQEYLKCIDIFEQVLKLNPEFYFAYLGLTIAYVQLELNKEAERSASELLKYRPNFSINKFLKIVPIKSHALLEIARESYLKAGLPE
jgi:adenylate cyclase